MNELGSNCCKFEPSVTVPTLGESETCAKNIFLNRRTSAPVNDFQSHREFLDESDEI
jgi:hypothetical protein